MNKSVPTTTIPYLSEWYVIYTKSPRSLHPFDRTLTSGMVSNVAICYNCESVVCLDIESVQHWGGINEQPFVCLLWRNF